MSFRLKTILGIALIEAALLLLLIWMGLNLIENAQLEALQKRAQTIAKLYATTAKNPVLSSDLASLDSFSAEVMNNPGLLYAQVRDQGGFLMAERGEYQAAQKLSPSELFVAKAAIEAGGSYYGEVEVGLNADGIEVLLKTAKSNASALALLEISLVALFSFVLGTWLTRQVRALESGAQKVSKGELGHQIPVRGNDELARTTLAFNRMSSELKRLYGELTEANQALEAKVRERSRELKLIYRVSDISVDLQTPLHQVLDALVQIITEQESKTSAVCTRILFDDNSYQSSNYTAADTSVSSHILIGGRIRGYIELGCLASPSQCLKQQFIPNKKPLLDAISLDLGAMIEHRESLQDKSQMEAQLRHAQKLESVGLLAAGIAHEINTPAQFVNDNTHFLQDACNDILRLQHQYEQVLEQLDEENTPAEALRKLRDLATELDMDYLKNEAPIAFQQSLEGLQRISKIVKAMKEFAHPGSSKKVKLDLHEQIETTVNVSRNEWKYHAELITDFDRNLPYVSVLPDEFKQVILNLVVNAAHAIEASAQKTGEISIQTRREGDEAIIRIRDNGCGIPEAIQSRVFDPFFTTKEVGKGSGQGLAIAYNIVVDKHQGSLTLKSQEGRGAQFEIRLPLEETEQTA